MNENKGVFRPIFIGVVTTVLATVILYYLGFEKSASPPNVSRDTSSSTPFDREKKGELTQDLEKSQPTKRGTPFRDDVASVINIAGSWHDPNNPANGSRITQEGNSFQFNSWGVLPQRIPFVSTGSGTITGQDIKTTYTTRYQNGWIARGNCSGAVSRDESRMTLTCTDNVLGTFVISGVRQ
ncbi:hypothetical protein L0337_25085 [candidate division KSB1 bacterium]|nr:hypothetical protein [candidate division KSB1 bacterium]